MIDIVDKGAMTDEERRAIANRAVNTYPYFYKMEFDVKNGISQYADQRIGIKRDFFLTEMIGNFGLTGFTGLTEYNFNAYTGYNESVYRYIIQHGLPSPFLVQEADRVSPIISKQQFEFMPFKVDANDFIYANITAVVPPTGDKTIFVGFNGFSVLDDPVIGDQQVIDIETSLANPVKWDWFNTTIDDPGAGKTQRSIHIIENDKYPRLIVGMSRHVVPALNNPADIFIDLYDISRRLRLTDTHIPLNLLAPVPFQPFTFPDNEYHTTPAYYLPVEYYWEPYAKIQIDAIATRSTFIADESASTIGILTRTV